MTAALLLTLSAFLHALWNAIAKKAETPSVQVVGIIVFAAVFSLGFIPFFDAPSFPNLASVLWAIGSGLCESSYLVTLALTLDRSPMGSSYTVMRGGAMILVWLISSLVLGEKVSPVILIGVAGVIYGLYLTTASRRSSAEKLSGWAYLCAASIAGYHLCYGQALEHGANPASLFSLSLWVALPILFLFYGRRGAQSVNEAFRAAPVRMLFAGLICAGSFLIFLVGLRHSGAGAALTLRNSSVVFAQIFALGIGEKIGLTQWMGALLVAGGAALVGLGAS